MLMGIQKPGTRPQPKIKQEWDRLQLIEKGSQNVYLQIQKWNKTPGNHLDQYIVTT
jgi:hypothetical protein